MKRVGIVAKPDAPRAPEVVTRLVDWLTPRGIEVTLEKETAGIVPAVRAAAANKAELPGLSDLLIVLGGDGTLLSMARAVGDLGVPIMGVNLGGLGFLTATTLDEMLPSLEAALQGHMVVEDRLMLRARVIRNGAAVCEHMALNDAVLHKGGAARVIRLLVRASGEEVGTYSADGIILSTPTGSTAYSLSAGGPIVSPSVHCIVATPICPHTLSVRPLVLPADETVTVEVLSPTEELILTIDGQEHETLLPGARIVVSRAPNPVRLVRFPGQTFFSTLRRKLNWGDLEERNRAPVIP